MSLLLGCIADDMTGATDLGSILVQEGLATLMTVGVPSGPLDIGGSQAIVVALKSRMLPAPAAVEQSQGAYAWLKGVGAQQILFKYCSTFDSTDAGNIGPVGDALLDAAGAACTIVCPAYPANSRTVYQANLFVGSQLLSESPMRNHPLTPMTDANLVRVLSRQTRRPVGHIAYDDIAKGTAVIRARLDMLKRAGMAFVVVDAIDDRHLHDIAAACFDLPLLTGGAAIASGVVQNLRARGLLSERGRVDPPIWPKGRTVILAGSNSVATHAQIAAVRERWPSRRLDALALAVDDAPIEAAAQWAIRQPDDGPVLIYSSALPGRLAAVQAQLGRDRAGALVERAFERIAVQLVDAGVRRLIIAGGETSGAVIAGLGVRQLQIGPAIAPGVPWTLSPDAPGIALALKSGNFGGPGFFIEALEMLP
jgi:uncharacterized protein YgbK (DUF1537 family)